MNSYWSTFVEYGMIEVVIYTAIAFMMLIGVKFLIKYIRGKDNPMNLLVAITAVWFSMMLLLVDILGKHDIRETDLKVIVKKFVWADSGLSVSQVTNSMEGMSTVVILFRIIVAVSIVSFAVYYWIKTRDKTK